jgi:hypothetical protein
MIDRVQREHGIRNRTSPLSPRRSTTAATLETRCEDVPYGTTNGQITAGRE